MPLPPGGHPAWNLYFACEDADATIARAGELGAETVHGADRRAQRLALRDPARSAQRGVQRCVRGDGPVVAGPL